jgi:hypothetical protein
MFKHFSSLWLFFILTAGLIGQTQDTSLLGEYVGFIEGSSLNILDINNPGKLCQTIEGDIYAWDWMKKGDGLYFAILIGEKLELRKLPSVGADTILLHSFTIKPGELERDCPIQDRVSLNCLSDDNLVIRLQLGGWIQPNDIQEYYYNNSLDKLSMIDSNRYMEQVHLATTKIISDKFEIVNILTNGIYELYKIEYMTDTTSGEKKKKQTRLTFTEDLERSVEEPCEITYDLSPSKEMLVYNVFDAFVDMAHYSTYLINLDGSQNVEHKGDYAWLNSGDLLSVSSEPYNDGSEYGANKYFLTRIDAKRNITTIYETLHWISGLMVKK